MKTRAWILPRSSSAEASVAPFSRMRFGSSIESLTSGSTPTPPRSPVTRAHGLRRAAPHELRILPRAEREALRRDVDGLEEVRLAGAVRPRDEDEPGLERELEAGVGADVPERDLRDDQRATMV